MTTIAIESQKVHIGDTGIGMMSSSDEIEIVTENAIEVMTGKETRGGMMIDGGTERVAMVMIGKEDAKTQTETADLQKHPPPPPQHRPSTPSPPNSETPPPPTPPTPPQTHLPAPAHPHLHPRPQQQQWVP